MTNAGFIVAAYGLTGLVLMGYALSLWRRLSRAREEVRAARSDAAHR